MQLRGLSLSCLWVYQYLNYSRLQFHAFLLFIIFIWSWWKNKLLHMKKLFFFNFQNLILLIILILFSCSNPLEKKYDNKRVKKDLMIFKQKLSPKDFTILDNTIITLSYDIEKLEKLSYQEILEEGKYLNRLKENKKSKLQQKDNFEKEKRRRYLKVIKRLKIIRKAEIYYYDKYGYYTKDKQALISFIDTGKVVITKKINNKLDTLGYEPVLKYFKNRNFKNMFDVPNIDNTEFILEIGMVEKVIGLSIPVFIAKIDKEIILKGLNPDLIKIEIETTSDYEVKGKFISVGSLEEITSGGNWPVYYDKEK